MSAAIVVARPAGQAIERDNPARRLLAAFLKARNTHTLKAYQQDLASLAGFVGASCAEEAAERLLQLPGGRANELVLSYRGDLLERGLSPATINRRLSTVRALTKLGRMLGMISWSIEVESLPANAYRDTRGPGELAIQRMLEQLRETPKGVRDAAIVRLLHDMALRRGEVCSLDRAHFDPDRHALFVLGKKRLERVWLTMPPATQRALEAWIEVRGDEPGPLFTALDNVHLDHRLTGAAVYAIIRKLGVSVGVVTRPHGLRHTAITGALDKSDGNMRKAQQFSRHKDVRTLGKYDDNRRDFGGEMAALVALPEREGPAPAPQKRAPKPKVHWLAFAQFIGAQRVAWRPEQAGDGTLERFLAQYRGNREAARVEIRAELEDYRERNKKT